MMGTSERASHSPGTPGTSGASTAYREQIVSGLEPVRPLASPSRRVWMLVPLGVLFVASVPLLTGSRRDLVAYSPLITWVATGVQSLAGLWLLALGFREAVPGRNVSRRSLAIAAGSTVALMVAVTFATYAVSRTVVPVGREWRDWSECVVWPAMLGAPFMVIATLMAVRAFPTRPALAGGLCGLAAGVLSDAGWRLSCGISDPVHILDAHGLAMLLLAAAGALLAIAADRPRWTRLHRST